MKVNRIPIEKRPWINKLFDIESNLSDSDKINQVNKTWSEAEVNEIVYKSKSELLSLSGSLTAARSSDDNYYSYFDKLSILPAQSKPIKNMKYL